MKVAVVFGTRPEAIKMAPVVKALRDAVDIDLLVISTGQHQEMVQQVLDIFGIEPDHDLAVMKQAQSLTHVTAAVLTALEPVLERHAPDWVLVHGDTTTTMAASLAAYYQQIPVGHVEAGLRTGDIYSPWPEEINRSVAGRIATAHFAPTQTARQNLLAEGISDEQILVTGNTVIDALFWVRDHVLTQQDERERLDSHFDYLDPSRRLVLVTGHRRESFDGGLDRMCAALARLAERGDVEIIYPVHLNPVVREATKRGLGDSAAVHLVEPVGYLAFVWLMQRSALIISDSGGVQEEAPALGKPVLVTREVTERPEAVTAGTVRLVGTDTDLIVAEATRLLDDQEIYDEMTSRISPYGDGHSAGRIVDFLQGTSTV